MKSEKSDLVSHSKAEIVQNSSLSSFCFCFFLLFCFCVVFWAEFYRRPRNILWSAKMMETTTCANSDEYMAWLSQKWLAPGLVITQVMSTWLGYYTIDEYLAWLSHKWWAPGLVITQVMNTWLGYHKYLTWLSHKWWVPDLVITQVTDTAVGGFVMGDGVV